MKILVLTWILVAPVLAFTQSRDTVFSVKAAEVKVQLGNPVKTLFRGQTKKFRIILSAGTKIDSVYFSSGNAIVKDSILLLKPAKLQTALLKIWARTTGKAVLALVKDFDVQDFVPAEANLDGVSADSAIHRMRASAMGYIYVPSEKDPELKTKLSYPVVSFELQTWGKGKLDTTVAKGNRMTLAMREIVDKMEGGNVLVFNNIRYLDDNRDTLIAAPLRVYVRNDKIVKF